MNDEVKKLKCGLVMPISAIDSCAADHWVEVKEVIKEALIDTQFSVELVSDSDESGIIQKSIVQNIHDNDIIVCDVSAKNPNVMFELGMRLAFDKPAIIIKDDKTNYSFDTGSIEHLEYPRDLHYHTIQAFKIKLRDKVVATYAASLKPEYTTFLKHFGQFVVAKIDEKKVGKDEYLLAAVSELRSEVHMLAKSVRLREDRPTGKLRDLMLGHDITPTNTYATRYLPAMEFIQNYFKNNCAPFTAEEAATTKVEEFHDLCDQYLKRYKFIDKEGKLRKQEAIRKDLLEALQFCDLI